MSFKCDKCGPVPDGTKMVKKAAAIRPVAYVTQDYRGGTLRERRGSEIAKEHKLCTACADRHDQMPAIVAGPQKMVAKRLPRPAMT